MINLMSLMIIIVNNLFLDLCCYYLKVKSYNEFAKEESKVIIG